MVAGRRAPEIPQTLKDPLKLGPVTNAVRRAYRPITYLLREIPGRQLHIPDYSQSLFAFANSLVD